METKKAVVNIERHVLLRTWFLKEDEVGCLYTKGYGGSLSLNEFVNRAFRDGTVKITIERIDDGD